MKWDTLEIKRLKKIQMFETNLVMLFFFLLFAYFLKSGEEIFFLFLLFCVLFWLVSASKLYTLITGHTIGTKNDRLLNEYEKDRLGEGNWKRKHVKDIVIIFALSVVSTALLFVLDFESVRWDSIMDLFPFIGAWIGLNVGMVIRIKRLEE